MMRRVAKLTVGARARAALLVALATACAEPDAPGVERLSLARGFRPSSGPSSGVATPWLAPVGSDEPLRLVGEPDSAGLWVGTDVALRDWQTSAVPGIARFRYPFAPDGVPPDGGAAFRVTAPGRTFEPFSFGVGGRDLEDLTPGTVSVVRRNLYLVLEEGVLPPESARFEVYVDRGHELDGEWRVTVGAYTAPGLPVWSGHEEEVVTRIPPRSALRLATVCEASLPDFGDESIALTFVVELDGETLLRHEQRLGDVTQADAHTLVLPERGADEARFTFRVEGPAAVAAFLSPVIGPAEVAPFDARGGPPNVVLFLADTFRADNMSTYGGEPGLTPNLDRLAAESLVFERAWSVSSWTLPAQTSMISGLHPHQHGVVHRSRRLADAAVTIAERFADAGYRTGAVTGGGYLAPAFAFDQGFSWFDQSWFRWDVEETTADVEDFLDTDDGRPVFLFVQTYRAHGPFLVRDATREALEGRLDLDRDWRELEPVVETFQELVRDGRPRTPEVERDLAALEDLYRGAVHDLDRGFGVFLQMLERRGLRESSYLLFTSDHGEAFGEHETVLHGDGVWDENVRVPLLVAGPDVEARRVPWSATLVDVPRTLAALADVAPHPSWNGVSLVDLDEDRPALVFDCSLSGDDFRAAVVHGPRKLLFDDVPAPTGELSGVFDLEADPAERSNLLEASFPWTEADRAWLRQLLERAKEPQLESEGAVLDDEGRRAMDALGYAGDHE